MLVRINSNFYKTEDILTVTRIEGASVNCSFVTDCYFDVIFKYKNNKNEGNVFERVVEQLTSSEKYGNQRRRTGDMMKKQLIKRRDVLLSYWESYGVEAAKFKSI